MTFDLIVFGHLTHDIIVTSDKGIHESLGGVATYTSLTAAKLGAVVGVVTKVGMDFRDEYLEYLQKAKIDLLGLEVKMGKTTVFENSYDEWGKRTQRLLSHMEPIGSEDIPAAYFNAKCFHFGPVFHEISYDTIKLARAKRILTSLDPQGYCRERGPNHVVELRRWVEAKEVLPYVDILKCDETEAEKLTGTGDLGKAAKLIYGLGPSIVLITQGVKGSILCYEDALERVPVIPAEKLVDSTGAGDAYAAGFIVEYLRTKDPKRSALYASCVASFVVEGVGTTTLPIRGMVMKRLHAFLKRSLEIKNSYH
ncbi:MAG: putative sugar kinase [Candidatus Bathyarchaeota archaeon BA1]|nr:MAG: putative sugar kinase [Candidatus Bathyarchaeota archaeon BA1]